MHPRNIYNSPPDFSDLALKYPEFLKISKLNINGKVKIDFKDVNSIRILTKCLLHKDFGLNVDIPPNRLVPTVPLRLNYILWLDDLIKVAGITGDICGIDIGTGACCIYPLLAAVKLKWTMLGTEVNENSVNMAYKNVRDNKLEKYITVKKVDENSNLIKHCFKAYGGTLDEAVFCMCNPPFYASAEDMDISRTPTRDPPSNARTGTLQEVVTDGGEIEFVKKLILESISLKTKIKIYTTMLGHKSSLKPLLNIIKKLNIPQFSHTNFVQGKTMRWGLAWSFIESTNLNKIQPTKKVKNKCLCFEIPPIDGLAYKVRDISSKTLQILKQINLECKVLQNKDVICTMEVKASSNTWSHQRKKRREEILGNACNSADIPVPDSSENLKRKLSKSEEVNEKRLKISEESFCKKADNFESSHVSFLTMAVCVRQNDNSIVLEVGYVDGVAGKDGIHQIVQYIKNNWK